MLLYLKLVRPLVILIILVFLFTPIHASARSFTIDAVDINAYIFPNGDLYVEELYTYTFDGSFNGTTRIIGNDGHNGFEFFEGYEAPNDAEIGFITFDDVIPLRVELDGNSFRIHRTYQDETKKVFYRYRLRDAIQKYEDVGEFYWRFFDEMGDEDLHHLRVFVQVYGVPELPTGTYGFMHDLFGGDYQLFESGLYYENEVLPGGKPFELRLLFPTEFLYEMDYTKKEEMLPTILKEEEVYNEKLASRNKWLPVSENISLIMFWLFTILAFYVVIYPKRIIRLFSHSAKAHELEKVDSLTLTVIRRKMKIMPQDINAALFRLYQKGLVTVERTNLDEEDNHDLFINPTSTFIFTIDQVPTNLREHEHYLIDWLFTETENGKRTFSLEDIPLNHRIRPTMSMQERNNLIASKHDFKKKFKEWKKLVTKDEEMLEWVKPVKLRNTFVYFIIPVWMIWTIVNFYLGMGTDRLFGVAAFAAIYMFALLSKRHRIVFTLFFFILFGAFTDLGLDPGMENLELTLFPLMIISIFLPTVYPTLKGIQFSKGIKKWIKSLRKGVFFIPESQGRIETFYQHAIALDHALLFMANFDDILQNSDTDSIYPFLIKPEETARIYAHSYAAYRTTYGSSAGGGSSSSSGGSGGGGGAGAF